METPQYIKISDGYQVEALEQKTTGEIVTHLLTKADINEMFRKKQYLESFLESANNKISQILDNLTADNWYKESVSKEAVLLDISEILDFEPKQTLHWTAEVTIEGQTDVPLNEIEGFDLRYFLNDELSVDVNHGDTIVSSHYVTDTVREEWE